MFGPEPDGTPYGTFLASRLLVVFLLFVGALSIFLAYDGMISTHLTDAWQVHTGVMVLGFMQVLAFVFVSRSRNRSDDRYHALAAIGSNGVWYLTFNSVFFYSLFAAVRPADGSIPYDLFLPFTVGTIAGGLLAAHYSQKIERWMELHAGPVAKGENIESQTLAELCVGQLREAGRRWWLYLSLLGLAFYFLATSDSPSTVAWLMLLAYGQNIAFGLGSRAKNRNSALYIVFTSILGTLALFFVWRVLVVQGMPLELFMPYTAATVLGSITGARVSMIIEQLFGIRPDDHVQVAESNEEKKEREKARTRREHMLWKVVCSIGGVVVLVTPALTNVSILGLALVLCAAFMNSGVHILASRAGNRNHVPYHFVTRLVWGFGWFFLTAAAVYYEMSYAILAPYLLGSVLGNLFGYTIAVSVEKKLCAVMDVPAPAKA
ncbi:MAG: hypothetical protein Q8P56_03385 [Candidatus Uhrbacteria bacterium]|nr:hypothetical protein [Candidatus Uhrbacteria bacterium]